MEPIKIKVYGVFKVTKKTFFIVEGIMAVFFIAALIFTVFYYDKPIEEYPIGSERWWAQYSIWIWIGCLLMVIMESQFYLQRFTKAQLLVIDSQKHQIEEKNEELKQLVEEVKTQRDRIEEIHHEVSQSIDYAKRIQSSMLPDIKLLEDELADCFVLFKPKDIVSGDFYWWTKIEDTSIITAADCTGHGVPGAFMSMLGISLLREIVLKEYITHPAVILRKLRKEIINTLKQKGITGEQKDGMDMCLLSIDHKSNTLQFAGANNPLYMIRNNELTEYRGDKMPIAIYEKMDNFTSTEIKLQAGDQLYIFSDGYADQFGGEKGKKFKYRSFKDLLLANADKPMNKQKEILDQTIEKWKGNIEQIDDIVVLGIKL